MPVSLDAFRTQVAERLHSKYGVPIHFLETHIFAKTFPLDRDVRAAFWAQYDNEEMGTSAEANASLMFYDVRFTTVSDRALAIAKAKIAEMQGRGY